MEQTKERLLSHYREREPTALRQYDGFLNHFGESVMHPDVDGDCLASTSTLELMRSDVRVLIKREVSAAEAVRLLHKIALWIERDGISEFRNKLVAERSNRDEPF